MEKPGRHHRNQMIKVTEQSEIVYYQTDTFLPNMCKLNQIMEKHHTNFNWGNFYFKVFALKGVTGTTGKTQMGSED